MVAVKGIQYSYQIDLFNQVPTHVKTKVRNLPVLSVPEATPLDRAIRDDFRPGARNQTMPGENTGIETAVGQINGVPTAAQPEATILNSQDAAAQANTRNITAAEYNRAIRAYTAPRGINANNGFESAVPPATSSIKEFSPPSEPENKFSAAQAGRPATPVTDAPVPERTAASEPANLEPADTIASPTTEMADNPVNHQTGENFLSRQAFNLYELIGRAGLLTTPNTVDFYF